MFSAKLFLLSAVVAAAGFVQAAPQFAPKHWPFDPAHPLISVRYCEGANLAGAHCTATYATPGECTAVEPEFMDKVGSFAVGTEGNCFLFSEDNCEGSRRVAVSSPDSGLDLAARGLDHSLKSYRCIYRIQT